MPEWVVARWPLKLLALGLAFAIWIAVTGEGRVIQTFDVPLDISLNESLVLKGSRVSTVQVSMRGPESLMRNVNPLRLAFRIDERDALPGELELLLTPDRLAPRVPPGIEVTRIDPDRLNLRVEPRLRRTLDVVPDFQGKPPEGYALYESRVQPQTVEVEGPEDEVSKLERVRTEPIRLDQQTESFTARVRAIPESPEARVVDPRSIEVRVEIDVAPKEVTVDKLPITVVGQTYQTTVEPATLRVVLSGPPRLLETLGRDRVRAVVDAAGLEPRSYQKMPVRVEFLDVVPRDLARIKIQSQSRDQVGVRVSDRKAS